ncbi:phosphate ABC transporter permease subunit PstC [Solemya velum gill symbiont]|uniref:phosphate ABC transporter permease subunit PstC n=1 Tax=Solemya velum gill symbiont TaxID=2340 RepID=UPI0005BDCBE4|nr:phosphate ABC transporter permease subunit PstC [Solemya velum gill symbiont]OOY43344.1 phosphate ABC transporter permease subunit PstC [Solemya velum gill symbiont]OOY49016.1 phosphate ABC transporter permease subunit PstC [Solemya velum gill symbiont]OOY59716.1 phosphate ABC transporter permease subunit PstC [Solemya velum gill symbiont]OOY63190.1 phosphate ABC transporter permease subunit PstC [Solemya velum gill symbiont]OOY65698.1 phosphate ABC transporter permease subunit PstC [Solemy
MGTPLLLLILLLIMSGLYVLGKKRALASVDGWSGIRHLHSLPSYYGFYAALWAGLPAFLVLVLWNGFQDTFIMDLVVSGLPQELQKLEEAPLSLVINDIKNLAAGDVVSADSEAIQAAAAHYSSLQATAMAAKAVLILILAALGGVYAMRVITPQLRARNLVESIIKGLLILCSTLAIFTTVGIVLSVLFESIRFFQMIPVTDFLFGTHYNPGTLSFGAVPLFAGTLLISLIAMVIAVPIGLLAAVYLAEYASPNLRAYAKPVLEILAGIPTVVYGFFAALTVAPFIAELGTSVGLTVSTESALAAGVVMGIMIIPFISSLSDDVINSVPQAMRDASYGLGATRSETITKVILPAALPGIVGSVLLAASRAIGETMIVVMAAGLAAKLTANPLDTVTTVTVQIVTALVGDNEFDSPKTLVAFALGLVLFFVTLALNVVALHVVRKYREQYD